MRIDLREVILVVLTALAIYLQCFATVHWIIPPLLATPFLLGTLPKLRILPFMSKKRTPPATVSGKGPKMLLKRSTNTLLALVIPPVHLPKGRRTSQKNKGQSEPNSPRAFTPLSPTSMGIAYLERMHFNGDKYSFFAKTKFAGCLREGECDELFKVVNWVHFKGGDTIFEAGESTASGLFMVVDGELSV
eukprot:CAMPEP_0174933610 /NCGR_PEP_ID=MMETSP1355-20121228/46271_1 /TAXON_ID=464990 /ORGANISM="Hemiselmis tepida, Strain CCMP443" /LENGTH=189 /DNA_ID=CAMNT_0016180131 /DNA_START=58 /DNA_END=624 /DNA_ORIENTATION=+